MSRMGAPYGERHGKAKVPDSIVREIRDRHYDNGDPIPELAREYNIPYYTVRDWVQFRTRVHH